MLKDIVDVKPLAGYRLWVRFEDGAEGEFDLAAITPFEGVFAPLKARPEFEKVRVNRELGAIEWECGADVDPSTLYSLVTGQPIPDYSRRQKAS